ncbi:MAG TPA: protoporphyrinogen oxidase, partial [Bacteroidales bacterium]|nr:protoporphyrinogen oxidase [Bacteroidales bacterium]
MSKQRETDIVVIGAGLTGLTLAHNLRKRKAAFTVLERAEKIGGVIGTVERNGFVFETGPNTGVLGNDTVPELFDDLASYCKLEIAGKNVNKRYIVKGGRMVPMPMGLLGGITTPLFTFSDKLRILGEPFRKPGTDPHETLDKFVVRRLGKSFLTYAVDPFILGVYAGDPSYLVPKYALPKLYNLEQNYGSFIGGSVKLAKEKKKSGIKSRATREIFSVSGGLQNLTHALYRSAGEENFITGVNHLSVKPIEGGFLVSGKLGDEELTVKANKVVTTSGAHEIPSILPFIDEKSLKAVSN